MNLKEKKISSKKVYNGDFLTIKKDKVVCPNGNLATREFVDKCDASVIIAKTKDNKFILERQFRYPYNEEIFEFPAGKKDKNETNEDTALRELEEETGFKAKTIKYLGKTYPSPAYTNEIIYIFFAKDLIKTSQHLDQNEFVEILYKDEEEIKTMIKDGKIVDSKTVHAFSLYLLNKENI